MRQKLNTNWNFTKIIMFWYKDGMGDSYLMSCTPAVTQVQSRFCSNYSKDDNITYTQWLSMNISRGFELKSAYHFHLFYPWSIVVVLSVEYLFDKVAVSKRGKKHYPNNDEVWSHCFQAPCFFLTNCKFKSTCCIVSSINRLLL